MRERENICELAAHGCVRMCIVHVKCGVCLHEVDMCRSEMLP